MTRIAKLPTFLFAVLLPVSVLAQEQTALPPDNLAECIPQQLWTPIHKLSPGKNIGVEKFRTQFIIVQNEHSQSTSIRTYATISIERGFFGLIGEGIGLLEECHGTTQIIENGPVSLDHDQSFLLQSTAPIETLKVVVETNEKWEYILDPDLNCTDPGSKMRSIFDLPTSVKDGITLVVINEKDDLSHDCL